MKADPIQPEVQRLDTPAGRSRRRLDKARPPSLADKALRAVWGLVWATLYRWSPTPLHAWRRALLRVFGARIGPGAHPYPTARIHAPWRLALGAGACLGPRVICYSVGRIEIGARAVVSQGAHLCGASHDHRESDFPLLVGDIRIGAEAWIAAEAFVGPGVAVGRRAVIGARAVVMRDVPAGAVMAGHPARPVGER